MAISTKLDEVQLFKYRIEEAFIGQEVATLDRILTIDISIDNILRGLHLLHKDSPQFDKIRINFPNSVELTEKFEQKVVRESKGWS